MTFFDEQFIWRSALFQWQASGEKQSGRLVSPDAPVRSCWWLWGPTKTADDCGTTLTATSPANQVRQQADDISDNMHIGIVQVYTPDGTCFRLTTYQTPRLIVIVGVLPKISITSTTRANLEPLEHHSLRQFNGFKSQWIAVRIRVEVSRIYYRTWPLQLWF